MYRIDAVESVVDSDVLNRFVSDVANVSDVADVVKGLSELKAKLPTGGQPSGENLLPTECGGTPSDQWNVLKFSPDVYHFLRDVGDAIGVKPLLVVA